MQHINLIPPEARRLSTQGWIRKYLLKSPIFKVSMSIFLLLFLISVFELSALTKYKHKISSQKKQITQLEMDLEHNKSIQAQIRKEIETIEEENKYFQKRLSFLEKAQRERVSWSDVLFVLTKVSPQDLWLNKVSLKKDLIIINGTTLDNTKVSDFMLKLDQSGYFKSTSFTFTQKDKDEKGEPIIDFEVATYLTSIKK